MNYNNKNLSYFYHILIYLRKNVKKIFYLTKKNVYYIFLN